MIYAATVEKQIHQYGDLRIDEAAGGGYIAYFNDCPGNACPTIGEAIRDAAETAEIEHEEATG